MCFAFQVRSDSSFLDEVKLGILKKATAVKNDAGSPTIGPFAEKANGTVEQVEECSPEENGHHNPAITSTPISSKKGGRYLLNNGKKEDFSRTQLSPTPSRPIIINDEPAVTKLLIDHERRRLDNVDVSSLLSTFLKLS